MVFAGAAIGFEGFAATTGALIKAGAAAIIGRGIFPSWTTGDGGAKGATGFGGSVMRMDSGEGMLGAVGEGGVSDINGAPEE